MHLFRQHEGGFVRRELSAKATTLEKVDIQ
jgi:hypothetical protein